MKDPPDATSGAELEFPSEAPPPRPAPAPQENLIGIIVANRYLVHRLLGHGGMGSVYEAEHVQLKKRVALKVLHGHLSVKPEVQARFEREAVAAGRITHPGVAAAHDFGRLPDGSFYLVLEHVDGVSLARVLKESPAFDVERAFRIMVQICSALAAAHAQGVIHRDLKPDNVMLVSAGEDDVVKVLDFGIAKIQTGESPSEAQRLTQAGLVFGTPEYMSPEQARGAQVDHRTDLYSLGMIGYEMLAGRSAFRAGDMMAILTAQMADPPPPLPDSVPEPLSRVIYSLLEKDPKARPQSAEELFEQLLQVSERTSYSMPAPRTAATRRFFPGGGPMSLGSTAMASIRALSMRPAATGGLPLWMPLTALLAGLGVGAFFVLREPAAQTQTEGTVEQRPASESKRRQLLASAQEGDRDALGELRRRVEQERALVEEAAEGTLPEPALEGQDGQPLSAADIVRRQARRFMALGRGYSVIRYHSAALSAYEDAVRLDPKLAKDSQLLVDVRVALAQRDAVEKGLEFALQLGAPGADMIYDIWTVHRGRPGMTAVVARAMRLVKGGELREQATPALLIAMDLEKARVCAEYRELLPRVIQYADERSLPTLKALRSQRGCGPRAQTDCFPCLRDSPELLKEAIAAASERSAPDFLAAAALVEKGG